MKDTDEKSIRIHYSVYGSRSVSIRHIGLVLYIPYTVPSTVQLSVLLNAIQTPTDTEILDTNMHGTGTTCPKKCTKLGTKNKGPHLVAV
jgi:hypothetical protein